MQFRYRERKAPWGHAPLWGSLRESAVAFYVKPLATPDFMNYITWALIGMVGYSFTTLLVKFATRGGQFSSFLVLAIACVITMTSTAWITLARGDLQHVSAKDFVSSCAWFAYDTGDALTVAVKSLFRALSLGPASVVVPIYGMFIVGGAILGILFLHEPVTTRKLVGIGLAIISIFLIAKK